MLNLVNIRSETHPVILRNPVTFEGLSARISKNEKLESWERHRFEEIAVKCGEKKATEREQQAFHDGIINLIKNLSQKFYNDKKNWYDDEDLTQACFARIWETLHMYNPEIAALSTWIHFVCNSILCRSYSENKKYNTRIVKWDDYKNNDYNEDDAGVSRGIEQYENGCTKPNDWMRLYMRSIIRELFEKHKNEQDILSEMFGDPFEETYEPPAHFHSKAEIARNVDREYSDVYGFFKNIVKPHFEKYFSEQIDIGN